jgi:hypothetical protein
MKTLPGTPLPKIGYDHSASGCKRLALAECAVGERKRLPHVPG